MLDTNNWVEYPFEVDGIQFVSKVSPEGDIYPRVVTLPPAIFNQMNEEAVREIIGNVSLLSTAELEAELVRINDGAVQALICLA